MRKDFPIAGGYTVTRVQRYEDEESINLYVAMDKDAARPTYLAPLPGRTTYRTVNVAAGKTLRPNGLYSYKDVVYGVMDNIAFKMDSAGTVTKLTGAVIGTISGPISWANNVTQVAFIDGVNLFVYTIATNVLTLVPFPGAMPPNPIAIYYQDDRLFIRFLNDSRIYFSNLGDFTGLSDSNFEIQQSRASVAKGLIGTNDRMFLIGDVSTEVWAPPTYASQDPIIRDNNMLYEFGGLSANSAIKGILTQNPGDPLTSFVAWLASDPNGSPCFVLSTGGAPIRLSDVAIEQLVESFTDPTDCFGLIYKIAGDVILEWTFLTDNITLICPLQTRKWSIKKQNNGNSSEWRGHAYANATHYVGTSLDNKIYTFDASTMTNDGTPINRIRRCKTFYDKDGHQISVGEFIVYFESGIVSPGEDPIAYIEVSHDFGHSWTAPKPARIGRIGEYDTAARWHNLGTNYNFDFRISVYNATRVFMMGAVIDFEVCDT